MLCSYAANASTALALHVLYTITKLATACVLLSKHVCTRVPSTACLNMHSKELLLCVLTSLAGTVGATCAACVAADATRAHCALEQLITLHTCISASSAATVASEICPSWCTSSSLLCMHQYTVQCVVVSDVWSARKEHMRCV
jgi:hypothetical protein